MLTCSASQTRAIAVLLATAPLLLTPAGACSDSTHGSRGGPAGEADTATAVPAKGSSDGPPRPLQPAAQAEADRQAALDRDFPLHGLVTGTQLRVRMEPNPDATVIGWLRVGSRIRLKPGITKTPTCNSGWYAIHPRGYACAGEGIEVSDAPQESVLAHSPAAKDDPLPYRYYFVKESKVPEWHRLPSRDEQRRAGEFVARYHAILEKNEARAQKFLRGEVVEDAVPGTKIVRRYLERGFFVAGAGIEERSGRKFVRTVRGSYVQLAQLQERTGSEFHGEVLDAERTLPIAWAVRTARPFELRHKHDGSVKFIADPDETPIERHTVLPWVGRERVGERVLHKLEDGRYLKSWFAAVAEQIPRPRGVGEDEPWAHVDLEQQTLVLYDGDTPVYATLISSGVEGHETPVGLFEVRRKLVADTMADIGPEAGEDRYSIEDVPWTQYFEGSYALHGAFWHERFGLQRSHGCVNLAPLDAHRVFDHTWPELGAGWHGVSTDGTGLKASKIYVTKG